MFFLSHIWRNIFRNKIRSLLTIGITMLLLSFVGVYLGNVEKNQSALNKLADSIPVAVQVMNPNGTQNIGLKIDTNKVDALLSSGIRNPAYTAQAGGNLEPINRVEHVKACDTSIVGANNFAAFASVSSESVKMINGKNTSFLEGNEPVCLISQNYAARHNIVLGQKLTFPLYTYYYKADGISFEFKSAGEANLTVIGTFLDEAAINNGAGKDMIVPVNWLRSFVERSKVPFYYDSFRCTVKNPLQLNVFKANMEKLYFSEVQADAPDQRNGNALMIQDKVFIETAEKLRQNVETLQRFQLPIFIVVSLLMVLVTFLLLRNRRKEIAIASSLGQKKAVSAAQLFVEEMLLVLAGCVLAVPILSIAVGTGWRESVMACLPFLGCSCLGIWVAILMLLRFDTLSLLTKVD